MSTGTDNTKQQQEGQSVAETNCAGTIPIVPVRYAVVPRKDDSQPEYLYDAVDCGARLEKGFSPLKRAVYTARALRSGYVYLYDETKATLYIWEADGKGNYTEMQFASLEDYHKPGNMTAGQTLKSVWAFEDSNTVYIGFTTNLLTQKMVEKIESDSGFRNKFMQEIDIQELVNLNEQPTNQKHVFSAKELSSVVEEYKGDITDFDWSNYTEQEQVQQSVIESMADSYHSKAKSKIPAVVTLYDNEAITQDIGNIAGLYIHQIGDVHQAGRADEAGGLPDIALIDTSEITAESRRLYRKKVVLENLKQAMKGTYPKDKVNDIPRYTRLAKETLQYYNGGTRSNPREVSDNEAEVFALSNEHYNEPAAEIMEHVDQNKLNDFYERWSSLESKIAELKPLAREAIKDHASWLKTAEDFEVTDGKKLGAALSIYDRDNAKSSKALEITLALCIDGMGSVIPNDDATDDRDELLDAWVKDKSSPLYVAVAPYNPFKQEFNVFKDKADSTGDVIAAIGSGLELLHKKFPMTIATEITSKVVSSYTFRKLPGQTRWTRSGRVAKNVSRALRNHDVSELYQALSARYNVTSEVLDNSPIAKKTYRLVNMASDDLSAATVTNTLSSDGGSRTLTVGHTQTTTTQSKLISANLLREIGKAPISFFVAGLHAINLMSAVKSISKEQTGLTTANLISAIMGAAGAFSETALGLRAIATKAMPTNALVGRMSQNVIFKVIASKAWIRVTGYGGALAEGFVHVWQGIELDMAGDSDAANWSYGAGLALGAGGAVTTYATLSMMAAGSLTVPGVGWLVAGILLIGIGILCIVQRIKNTNTPFQIWLNRSCLGVNESRVGSPFNNGEAESKAYFAVCYSARTLDELPEGLEGKGISADAENEWHENFTALDSVEYLVHLPGYSKDYSDYEFRIYAYNEDDVEESNYKNHEALTRHASGTARKIYDQSGLILQIKKTLQHASAQSARLEIIYWPNKTLLSQSVKTQFFLDD